MKAIYQTTVLSLLTILGACGENTITAPGTYVPSQTETFTYNGVDTFQQVGKIYQADYVFVLDYSWTMKSARESLLSNLSNFTSTLRNQGIDYRIGIVQGTVQTAEANSMRLPTSFRSVLSPANAGNEWSLVQNDIALPNNPHMPFFLETSKRVLESSGPNFLRPSAQLVYAFVSDEGEKENFLGKTDAQWAESLTQFKADASQVNARAIVNAGATRLTAVAKAINSSESAANGSDIGDSRVARDIYGNFADTLNDLAVNVSTQNTKFSLKAKPAPETLEVFISNTKVESIWSYNENKNMLIFSEDNAPDFGNKLEIRYEPMLILSKTPNENALEVRVNDQIVEKSTSNGWSLVSGENRIRFNGSAIPSNGSQVRVIYQGE